MSQHLRSCIQCARHIRIRETTCPFCQASVPSERQTPPPFGNPTTRMRRALALSTVAATGMLGTACGGEVIGEPTTDMFTAADAYGVAPFDAPDDAADVVTSADAYGIAPFDAPDDTADVVTSADAYGIAPFDAADDVAESDAGAEAD